MQSAESFIVVKTANTAIVGTGMHRMLCPAESLHTAVAEDVVPKPQFWQASLFGAVPVPSPIPDWRTQLVIISCTRNTSRATSKGSSSVAFSCTTECQSSYMRYTECVESREDLPDLALDSIQRDGPSGSEA